MANDKLTIEQIEAEIVEFKDSQLHKVYTRPILKQLASVMRENEQLRKALENVKWLLNESSPADDQHQEQCYWSAQSTIEEVLSNKEGDNG